MRLRVRPCSDDEAIVVGAVTLIDLAVSSTSTLMSSMIGEFQLLPLGAFDEDLAVGDLHFDAGGDGMGCLPIRDIVRFLIRAPLAALGYYHTVQSISPPSF